MRHVEKSLIFSPNLMNTKGKKQFYFTCNNCQKHFKKKDFFHTWIFFPRTTLGKKDFFHKVTKCTSIFLPPMATSFNDQQVPGPILYATL